MDRFTFTFNPLIRFAFFYNLFISFYSIYSISILIFYFIFLIILIMFDLLEKKKNIITTVFSLCWWFRGRWSRRRLRKRRGIFRYRCRWRKYWFWYCFYIYFSWSTIRKYLIFFDFKFLNFGFITSFFFLKKRYSIWRSCPHSSWDLK